MTQSDPPPLPPQHVQPLNYASVPAHVPNYLVQAILVTIFCCVPFGIVAIVYAAQVNGKLSAGDYQGALDASKKANMWSWIGFGSALIVVLLQLLIVASRH